MEGKRKAPPSYFDEGTGAWIIRKGIRVRTSRSGASVLAVASVLRWFVTITSAVLVNVMIVYMAIDVAILYVAINVSILYVPIGVFEAVIAALLTARARVFHMSAVEFAGSHRSSHAWMPVIRRGKKLTVMASFAFVMNLFGKRHAVRLMAPAHFFHRRTDHNSARTVKAYMHVIDDYVAAIDVMKAKAHMHNRAVVEERSASPLAANEADAAVAETIVNAAVEANVRTPISLVPAVPAMLKAPVAGRPEHACGRDHPGSRNPVISAIFIPTPVAGGPEVARSRASGLLINRQSGRSDTYGDADRNSRRRRRGKRHQTNGQN